MIALRNDIEFGNRRLVGQKNAKKQIERILQSGRLSHAYLLSGPSGVGKTAFALALAEIINGIDHLTDLKGDVKTKKSSWYTHPDIHVFLPMPATSSLSELKTRLQMLSEDPYEIVDFSLRPALSDADSSKNRRAFYSIDYYHEEIRPKSVYKPNEGERVVIVITGIDTMRKESANAFLKLLEEPSDNVMFILTSSSTDQLLPTIVSRCQHIRMSPLSQQDISEGLVTYDGVSQADAEFLARLSDGNYALTRFFDVDTIQQTRTELIEFLRYSYTQDVPALLTLVKNWNTTLNRENQISLCNTLEQFLRDLMIYGETGKSHLVVNADQIDVIQKFCESMEDARLSDMIEQVQHLKSLLYQNVQFKYIFTALAIRFTYLMRGQNPVISEKDAWRHQPAYSEL